MSNIGFYCFTAPQVKVEPTMREKVVALTTEQRESLLFSFENGLQPAHLHSLAIPIDVIQYVYDIINAVQDRCRAYMRKEVIKTPAVMDGDKTVTEAIMNTQPVLASDLSLIVRTEFKDDFPQDFTAKIITEMYKWSKYDGTGTFAFYKSQIIL